MKASRSHRRPGRGGHRRCARRARRVSPVRLLGLLLVASLLLPLLASTAAALAGPCCDDCPDRAPLARAMPCEGACGEAAQLVCCNHEGESPLRDVDPRTPVAKSSIDPLLVHAPAVAPPALRLDTRAFDAARALHARSQLSVVLRL